MFDTWTDFFQSYHYMCWLFSTGLSHEDNVKKMKLLTFMQMAETRQEIDYETIQKEIGLEQEDIESFIIDGTLI